MNTLLIDFLALIALIPAVALVLQRVALASPVARSWAEPAAPQRSRAEQQVLIGLEA